MPKRPDPFERQPTRLGRFWRKYWIELVGALLALLAILVMSVGWEQFLAVGDNIQPGIIQFTAWLKEFIQTHFTLRDILGFAGVVLGLVFFVWRIRAWLENAESRRLYACPRCGSDLYRVHRSLLDRLFVIWFFPSGRRYQCVNPDCNWSALLHWGVHSRMQHAQSDNAHD